MYLLYLSEAGVTCGHYTMYVLFLSKAGRTCGYYTKYVLFLSEAGLTCRHYNLHLLVLNEAGLTFEHYTMPLLIPIKQVLHDNIVTCHPCIVSQYVRSYMCRFLFCFLSVRQVVCLDTVHTVIVSQ